MKSVAVVEPGARGALHQKLRYGESGSRSRLSWPRTLWDVVMGVACKHSLEITQWLITTLSIQLRELRTPSVKTRD